MGRADVLELCPSGVLRSPGLLPTGVAAVEQTARERGDHDEGRAEREAEGERGEPRAVEDPRAHGEHERGEAEGPGADPAVTEEVGQHERGDDAEREHEQVQEGHDSSITSSRPRTRGSVSSGSGHHRRYGVPCLPRDLGHNRGRDQRGLRLTAK